MSFFEDLPVAEPEPQQRYFEPAWRRIPLEFVPVALPASRLLHASPELAIVLTGVLVYPTGFTMTLTATRHPEAAPDHPSASLVDMLHGHGRALELPGERLRIGVLHSDGTRATYPESMRAAPGDEPSGCISSRGGGGSGEYASAGYFVWPMPTEGDLTLFFSWTAAGLRETGVVIPGDDLRTAAAGAREIWPGARMPEPPDSGFSGSWG